MKRQHLTDVETEVIASLGEAIHRQRKLRRWSLETLSEMVHVSIGHVSAIERGKAAPSLSMVIGIASAFGLRLSQLFALAELQTRIPAMEREVVSYVIPDELGGE